MHLIVLKMLTTRQCCKARGYTTVSFTPEHDNPRIMGYFHDCVNMMQVKRWVLLSVLVFLGQLVEVKTIPQPHIACQTLYTIHYDKLKIACNSDALLYINQLTLKSLGKQSSTIAANESECQRTSDSSCVRSIPLDIPWNYTFYRKVSKICNGNQNCTLQCHDFYSYVTQFQREFTCSNGDNLYHTRIGWFFECFQTKGQVLVGKNIAETKNGSLYLRSNETGRCLIRGSIESARILEQVNMRFNVSGRKSRLCTEVFTNESFNHNKDLSCLRGVNEFRLDIQTTDTSIGKLWIEFKGTSMQLVCGDNIQFPSIVGDVQDSEQNATSTLLPVIIGLIAGLLLLLALILVVLKRKHALTIKAEANHRTINATTTLEGDEDCTYYNNEVDKPRNDSNDVHGTSSSFDDSLYNTIDTGGNYSQINIKKNTSESGGRNGEHNVKNGADDTEKSRDTNNVTPRSSNTTEITPNTIIGEVTGDVYAAVCKTDDLKSMRITGPKGDIYATVSMASNVE